LRNDRIERHQHSLAEDRDRKEVDIAERHCSNRFCAQTADHRDGDDPLQHQPSLHTTGTERRTIAASSWRNPCGAGVTAVSAASFDPVCMENCFQHFVLKAV
jgi:hypothetical protein